MLHNDLLIKITNVQNSMTTPLSPRSAEVAAELQATVRENIQKRFEKASAHMNNVQGIYAVQMREHLQFVLDYSYHIDIIPALASLSLSEIKKRIDALLPLAVSTTSCATVGIFQLPQHAGKSIFDAISEHPVLSIDEKDSLIHLLIPKQYAQYFTVLFEHSTWKPLLENAEHVQRLRLVYKLLCRYKPSIQSVLHQRICQQLFRADPGFIYTRINAVMLVMEMPSGKKSLQQVLTAWDNSMLPATTSSAEIQEPIEQRIKRYVDLLKRYHQRLSSSFLMGLQDHFTMATSAWSAMGIVYQRAAVPLCYWDNFFTKWIFRMDQYEAASDVAAFKEHYMGYLSQQPQQTNLTINFYAWGFFLQHNVIAASQFLTEIQSRLSVQTHVELLLHWVRIVAAEQHDLLLMKQYFLFLSKPAAKGLLNEEDKIWGALFKANHLRAYDIFDEFVKLKMNRSKLLEFTRRWVDSMVERQAVLNASKHIQRRLKQAVSDVTLGEDLQKIISLHVLNQVEEKKGDDNEDAKRVTKSLLKSTRRNSFTTSAEEYSKTHYRIYHDLRYQVPNASHNLKSAQEKAENEINKNLQSIGEARSFRLNM